MSPTSYQQLKTRNRQMRRDHHGRTSRGLSVELARCFYENPLFGDDPAELLSDLKQCAAACIGAGCEPRVRPLPGHGQGVSLAAPAEADQVEGTPTYQQFQTRIRQMRRDHHGCTSRGLDVELARYFYESPIPGDFLPALLLDLQQCAAACIGAGCEPRVRPLPGQDGQGFSLAAPAAADQVEDTPTLEQFHRWLSAVAHKALLDSENPPADLHSARHVMHWVDCMNDVDDCRIATKLLMQFMHGAGK